MNGKLLNATTSAFLLIFLTQIQSNIYGHFSQPDPCATAKSDWQSAQSTTDAKYQTARDYPAKAAAHIAAASAATAAVAAVKCHHLKKKKPETLYYSCVSGMVTPVVAAASAVAATVLAQLVSDWHSAKAISDPLYSTYLDCLNNKRRDCDYDNSLDDCIKTTHAPACSCSDGYFNGQVYERPCPCEATHPH